MKRDLNALSNQEYDLLIIGGGIYGATIAWDAVLRGLSVALIERSDFGGGTSANILKIIHDQSHELGFTIDNPKQHAKGYHKQMSASNLLLGLLINKRKYMDKAEGKWKPFKNFYINGAAYGGLIGTPDAFMKYIRELLKSDCRLISEDYKKMLFTENHTKDNEATGMCLSWFKGQMNGNLYFAHAGGGGGYYCELRIYPDLGIGSVIMFNRTGMRNERFLDKVDKYFIGSEKKID